MYHKKKIFLEIHIFSNFNYELHFIIIKKFKKVMIFLIFDYNTFAKKFQAIEYLSS